MKRTVSQLLFIVNCEQKREFKWRSMRCRASDRDENKNFCSISAAWKIYAAPHSNKSNNKSGRKRAPNCSKPCIRNYEDLYEDGRPGRNGTLPWAARSEK